MLKLGLCCGSGVCCALLTGLLWLGGGLAVHGQESEVPAPKKLGCISEGYTQSDLDALAEQPAEQRVVAYLADKIEVGEMPELSSDELQEKLGLSMEQIEQLDETTIRAGVMAELSRRGFDLASLSGGNCSKFSACSVDRNLMNASGAELDRYEEEVALDGRSFTDRMAPDFTLPSTQGGQVSLSEYRGKNVALVFLSAHCFHSLDTLPILATLKQKYADQGLEILPVFINSGDASDLSSRKFEWAVEYPLLVSEGKAISEAYDSRMVPSTFLIDKQGRVVRQFVGFKDEATLDLAFAELVGASVALASR